MFRYRDLQSLMTVPNLNVIEEDSNEANCSINLRNKSES